MSIGYFSINFMLLTVLVLGSATQSGGNATTSVERGATSECQLSAACESQPDGGSSQGMIHTASGFND